ncbi:MAG: hypothetical protein BM557_04410 [Flavobacterium sp. MedPE-SWcel]|uniref:DUF4437 domain-containing protein n=1 Tax=uncultured Flavobacterium sp. TaxID=165435 RepID=UPI00091A4937|nr:DUF4437 domain-containing protein [uncultured Flavobacterium sp.]OIQ21010.1 MAG: hypothetical protein BM557_04410 [Flavobacterium sp. MedPE-SWcel]
MLHNKFLSILVIASITISCTNAKKESQSKTTDSTLSTTNQIILKSEINWESLNPARGDQSPKAGTIWGNRNGSEPTGFLAEFKDGFSSPPHIHNVTYRAIVINGLIHNNHPNAKEMWMPNGSFWTQPAGEPHITAAKGDKSIIAYVEIDKSPYLVKPIKDSFDSRERPINLDRSNIVWLDASKTRLVKDKSNAKIAFLWASDTLRGNLIKLPPKFQGKIISNGTIFRAITIQGETKYQVPNQEEVKILEPGSYFSSNGESIHKISSSDTEESIIYIRTNDNFIITE